MRPRNSDEYGFLTVILSSEDGKVIKKFTLEPKQGSARQSFLAEKVALYLEEEYTINE